MTRAPRPIVAMLTALLAACSPSHGARSDRDVAPAKVAAPDAIASGASVAPLVANASMPAARAPDAAPRAAPASLDLPPSNDAAPADAFPDEVTAFMVDRDACDHFRAEDPNDQERRAFLDENIAQLCTGTDAKLATLRQRHADDPAVVAALVQYEDQIEGKRD